MINLVYLKLNSEVTLYLRDSVVTGSYRSASWGVITLVGCTIAHIDGRMVQNAGNRKINIADVIAVGNTGTFGHAQRSDLCWEVDIIDYEINFKNKYAKYK